jgi:hypothetical protein
LARIVPFIAHCARLDKGGGLTVQRPLIQWDARTTQRSIQGQINDQGVRKPLIYKSILKNPS